jgi:hypothetical protein
MARKLIILFTVIVIGAAVAGVLFTHHKPTPIAQTTQPIAAIQPTTKPTTRRAATTFPCYMDAIRTDNPSIATTQPLAFAVDLPDAAHLIVHDPVYLDLSGHLWLTQADGEPAAKALQKPIETTEHVIREKPVFVHWWTTDAGDWAAAIVVKSPEGYDIITKTARQHLAGARPFRWANAFSIVGKIVVATDVGVCVYDIDPKITEHYHELPGCSPAGNPPVAITDTRGILAWAPWERGKPGSHGVSRFVDGSWTDLPVDQWPARPIQLSILLDGSVLRLSAPDPDSKTPSTAPATAPVVDDDVITTKPEPDATAAAFPDRINISIGQLDPLQFDGPHVNDLIARLNNEDGEIRQAAFEELSRYGPGISPLLEKVVDQQRPEGQMRIHQLLKNKLTPALGGLMPVDNRLTVARRYADGAVLFFAAAGVQIPTEQGEPALVDPAWIIQRADGRMERPLPPALVQDQKPDATTLVPAKDEWIVNDEAGPRRFFGNALEPLLSPSEARFSECVGMSQHRRWVLRDPKGTGTLIIDPMIADPTPKMPVWTIDMAKGTAGWDAANFPAVINENGSHWELTEDHWKSLPETDKINTPDATTNGVTTAPTTGPTTAPTTGSPGATLTDKPILSLPDGTHYFGGKDDLRVVDPAGVEKRWTLPAAAVGTADPILIQTPDKLLFLFNQAGRLLRIKPTPGQAEPFALEATFTRNIPEGDTPARIWLDPAGRIDWIADGKSLSILFPSGHIPKAIANMMIEVRP